MSAFTKGHKNAAAIGDVFENGDILVTSVSFANTASSTATLTHGLSATPTFLIDSGQSLSPAVSRGTINSTSITYTRTATTTSGTDRIDVIVGVKS